MGEIKNQAIKNSIVSYLGASIGFVNFIILLPYVFSAEQIGLTRLLQNSASLIVPFVELGAISVVLRFYPTFKDKSNERLSFISYCVFIAFIGFMAFSVIFIAFRSEISLIFLEKSPLVLDYYYLILPLVFFIAFTGIFEAVANSIYKTVLPNFLREVILRVAVSVLAILFVLHIIDFDQFVSTFVFAYCLPLLLLIMYLTKLRELRLNFSFTTISPTLLKEMAAYGLFVLLGSSGHLLVSYIDTIMLGSILGLADTGIYVTAFYMAVIIEIPRRSIRQIAIPHISEAWSSRNMSKIKDIYTKTSINQLIVGIYIFLGIWVNIDSIFDLMPNGETYREGKYVVLFVMIGKLIDMAAGTNGEIIALSKYYRFNMYSILVLALLAVITNIILIPIFGVNGAALATVISLFLYNLVKYAFIKFKFKIDPFGINTIKVILIGLVCLYILNLMPRLENPISDILIKSILITVIFGAPIYFTKVSLDANQLITSIFTKVFKRK